MNGNTILYKNQEAETILDILTRYKDKYYHVLMDNY